MLFDKQTFNRWLKTQPKHRTANQSSSTNHKRQEVDERLRKAEIEYNKRKYSERFPEQTKEPVPKQPESTREKFPELRISISEERKDYNPESTQSQEDDNSTQNRHVASSVASLPKPPVQGKNSNQTTDELVNNLQKFLQLPLPPTEKKGRSVSAPETPVTCKVRDSFMDGWPIAEKHFYRQSPEIHLGPRFLEVN